MSCLSHFLHFPASWAFNCSVIRTSTTFSRDDEVLGPHDGIMKSKGLRHFAFFPDAGVVDVPPITRYTLTAPGKLELRGSSTQTDIDAVVLGTGYSAASAPFVCVLQPPAASFSLNAAASSPDAHPLTSAHTAPPAHPRASRAVTWLALVFSGRLCILDSLDARLAGGRARLAKVERACAEGAARQGAEASSFVAYHVLGADENFPAPGLIRKLGAVLTQQADNLAMPPRQRRLDRGAAVIIFRVNIGTVSEQQAHNLKMAFVRCDLQRIHISL
ncbi:hypothetical protein FB451DRAFT_1405445 [Mycena latifolia]|nr:hypothetical protein FB451DRAFT_1405445 [Mycena latifolia]